MGDVQCKERCIGDVEGWCMGKERIANADVATYRVIQVFYAVSLPALHRALGPGA